jgi:hypothetical protein
MKLEESQKPWLGINEDNTNKKEYNFVLPLPQKPKIQYFGKILSLIKANVNQTIFPLPIEWQHSFLNTPEAIQKKLKNKTLILNQSKLSPTAKEYINKICFGNGTQEISLGKFLQNPQCKIEFHKNAKAGWMLSDEFKIHFQVRPKDSDWMEFDSNIIECRVEIVPKIAWPIWGVIFTLLGIGTIGLKFLLSAPKKADSLNSQEAKNDFFVAAQSPSFPNDSNKMDSQEEAKNDFFTGTQSPSFPNDSKGTKQNNFQTKQNNSKKEKNDFFSD